MGESFKRNTIEGWKIFNLNARQEPAGGVKPQKYRLKGKKNAEWRCSQHQPRKGNSPLNQARSNNNIL